MANGVQPTRPQKAALLRARQRRGTSRRIEVMIVLILGVLISGAAVLLSLAAGNNLPTAILTGGGAFAGAVGVLLAVVHYAGESP